MHNLYLVALLPPAHIAAHEQQIKEEIAQRFGAKEAARRPAHVTILPPIQATEPKMLEAIGVMGHVTAMTKPFSMHINGTGHFRDHTVFLAFEKCAEVQQLYSEIRNRLLQSSWMTKAHFDRGDTITPHMTIAFKLKNDGVAFDPVWNAYKDLEYKASFDVHELSIMKHNGKRWMPWKVLPFGTVSAQ